MTDQIILASGSEIRATLLRNAGIQFDVIKARIDEDMMKAGLLAEGLKGRDIADALAEMKALRVSSKHPTHIVVGCDQVLEHEGVLFSKPDSQNDAIKQLQCLRGSTHRLLSAVVIYQNGAPQWRHVSCVSMTMNDFSDNYLNDYVNRNWESIRYSVGAYKLEEEGIRLFQKINGDYFAVLGIPLLELISYLSIRGVLPS